MEIGKGKLAVAEGAAKERGLKIDTDSVEGMLEENSRRRAEAVAGFDPKLGKEGPGKRFHLGRGRGGYWLPEGMRSDPAWKTALTNGTDSREFDELRCRHDFAYWAGTRVGSAAREGATTCCSGLTVRSGGLSPNWRRCVRRESRSA